MKYTQIFDTHTHSINSFDGNHTVDEMIESAIDLGCKGIALTDHCDIDGMVDTCFDFQDKQFREVERARSIFGDKIKIYHGVELGQGIYEKELSEKFLSSYDFDFVLGSVHNLKNTEDFYFLDYSKYNVEELLKKYFGAVLETAKWNMTDSLAHITYPFRYLIDRGFMPDNISCCDDVIKEIFAVVIENGKAIELNVSGLNMTMHDTLPSKRYIKMYHDMGGKYVTVGSDSHYKDKIAVNVDTGYNILKECGFDSFTVFENRKPKCIKII